MVPTRAMATPTAIRIEMMRLLTVSPCRTTPRAWCARRDGRGRARVREPARAILIHRGAARDAYERNSAATSWKHQTPWPLGARRLGRGWGQAFLALDRTLFRSVADRV